MTQARHDVAERLHRVAIRLLRTLRAEDRALGLTPARASVLSILVFGGPRTLTQLTEAEQVAAPTMTKLIAGLERDGFTSRTAGEDGRVWVIRATAKAKRIMVRGKENRVALLLTLLTDASPAEWAALSSAVSSLERHLT